MSKNDSKTAHDQLAIHKEGGLTVYLMEELTDARMRCDQLKRYVAEAVKMVNKSEKRDHFFEVAGNLLYGIPEALFKLDKALDATALAASRLDYEELKQQLKPEKAEELEAVLNEARVRHIDRRSDPAPMLKGKTAMRTFKAASQDRIASHLRRIAEAVETGAIRPAAARNEVRRVLMALSQTAEQAVQAMGDMQADSREEVMEGFKKSNPDLSQAELEEIADQWEANKNVVKEKQAAKEFWKPVMNEDPKKIGVAWVRPGNQRDGESHAFQEATFDDGSTVVDNTSLCGKKFQSSAITKARAYGNTSSEVCDACKRKAKTAADEKQASSKDDWAKALQADEKMLAKVKKDLKTLEDGGEVENLTLANAKDMVSSLEQVIANKKKMLSKLGSQTEFEKTAASDSLSKLHDKTWEWTTEQVKALTNIAKEASAAKKKAASLQDKVEAQRVEKRALDGVRAVAGIFGETKTAADDSKLSEEEKQSKFEEGKPADPTENMSPEDAKKWREEHDKNKDKFKSASVYESVFKG